MRPKRPWWRLWRAVKRAGFRAWTPFDHVIHREALLPLAHLRVSYRSIRPGAFPAACDTVKALYEPISRDRR